MQSSRSLILIVVNNNFLNIITSCSPSNGVNSEDEKLKNVYQAVQYLQLWFESDVQNTSMCSRLQGKKKNHLK